MTDEEVEAIISLKEWAWQKVRDIMPKDDSCSIREFCLFENAMESTHRFLVDVCSMTCEAAAVPADIYEVYADILGDDLAEEDFD